MRSSVFGLDQVDSPKALAGQLCQLKLIGLLPGNASILSEGVSKHCKKSVQRWQKGYSTPVSVRICSLASRDVRQPGLRPAISPYTRKNIL